MKKPILAVEPVAIALEAVTVANAVRFSGIDLETGARTEVSIERALKGWFGPSCKQLDARGLVLVISIEQFTDNN